MSCLAEQFIIKLGRSSPVIATKSATCLFKDKLNQGGTARENQPLVLELDEGFFIKYQQMGIRDECQ
jgi:hypothetical protein